MINIPKWSETAELKEFLTYKVWLRTLLVGTISIFVFTKTIFNLLRLLMIIFGPDTRRDDYNEIIIDGNTNVKESEEAFSSRFFLDLLRTVFHH